MFRSGTFVADHVDPVSAPQVQPNGVDLTVTAIAEPVEAGWLGRDDKAVGERRQLTTDPGADGEGVYALPPGGYIVRYGETVAIPAEHIGFILPRSTLLRNGATLNTAVWDAGYEGQGAGLLQVTHDIEIAEGARIGQFVLAEAAHEGTYDGTYQGEGDT